MKNNNQNTTKNATTELLKYNPKALQFLHDFGGFDFCKPFEVVKTCGTFTANSIKKAIGKSSFDGLNIVILLKRECERTNNLYIAYIEDEKRVRSYTIGDLRNYNAYERGIDYEYSIGKFEEIRKKETEYIYIIYQSEEYRMPSRPHPYEVRQIDTGRRYKFIDAGKVVYSYNTGARFTKIVNIKIKDTITNANPVCYVFTIIPKYAPETVGEIIDKSGYIIIDRRDSLKERAAARRAERAKAEYLRQDFREENKRTREELTKTARKAGEMLSNATEETDFICIKNCVYSLRWAAYYLERHEEKTAKKEFASVESFKKSLENISVYTTKAAKAVEPIQQQVGKQN